MFSRSKELLFLQLILTHCQLQTCGCNLGHYLYTGHTFYIVIENVILHQRAILCFTETPPRHTCLGASTSEEFTTSGDM